MMLTTDALTIEIAGKTICHQLSLSFSAGQSWAILGPNGIGKTTFLKTLMGLHKPTAGQVMLDGQSLKRVKPKQLATQLGFLLQNHDYYFPNTLTETLANGAYAKNLTSTELHNQIDNAITQCHLNALQHKRVTQLSGGEKRLVDFATLLVQSPQYYLLDEPTNHLDLKHQRLLLNICKQLNHQGKTTLISTHDINLAYRHCDHVLMFFGNGLASYGNSQTLMQRDQLEKLYHCPVNKIEHADHTLWFIEH